MGAVKDAISGHVVTAAGRAAEIAVLSAGLLTGVILGLRVGIWFGLTLDPAEAVAADLTRFGISTAAAAAAAAMSALTCTPCGRCAAAALAGGAGSGRCTARSPCSRSSVRSWPPGSRGRRDRPGERAPAARHDGAPAGDRAVRDHPPAPRAHRVPRLLPAGLRAAAGRGEQVGAPITLALAIALALAGRGGRWASSSTPGPAPRRTSRSRTPGAHLEQAVDLLWVRADPVLVGGDHLAGKGEA